MKVIVDISRANNDQSGDSTAWMAEHGLGVIRKTQNLRRGTMDRKLKRNMVVHSPKEAEHIREQWKM